MVERLPLKSAFQSVHDAAQYLENEKFERVFGDDNYYYVSHCGLISAEIRMDDENKVVIIDYWG